jgi:hypothetical protein
MYQGAKIGLILCSVDFFQCDRIYGTKLAWLYGNLSHCKNRYHKNNKNMKIYKEFFKNFVYYIILEICGN